MNFYFTGTGNSLYIAQRLDQECISIPQVIHSENLHFKAEKIGIVCPMYGHEMPDMVKDFLKKATFETEYFYILLTYGNRHANAVELAAQQAKAAGRPADYINVVLMVDNYLPAFNMDEQRKIDKKIEEQITVIAKDIGEKKKGAPKVTLMDRAAHKMFLGYFESALNSRWPGYEITEDCVGCGICNKVCPAGCFSMKDQRAVVDVKNCQGCEACVHACPQMAIHFTIKEVNSRARYRNPNVTLSQIVSANDQTEAKKDKES